MRQGKGRKVGTVELNGREGVEKDGRGESDNKKEKTDRCDPVATSLATVCARVECGLM